MSFYPYHPRRFRLWLALAALAALALTLWAVVGFVTGGGPQELVRAAVSAGLLAAAATISVKLRPRTGWGVNVGPTAIMVSRPIRGQIDVPWSAVREVRRLGSDRNTLALVLRDQQILVPAHLFPSVRHFEAVVAAVEQHLPESGFDA